MKWNIYDAGDVVVLCPEFTRPDRGQFVESIVGTEAEARNYVRKKFPGRPRLQLVELGFGLFSWEKF